MRIFVSLLGISFLCAPALADELDLSLNSDALRVQYFRNFDSPGLRVDGGWLYHQDHGNVFHVGMSLTDLASTGRDKLEASLGGRLVYTDGDMSNQDGFAVPLGGSLRFTPRAMNRLSVSGSAFFAPDILSVGDLKKYQEYSIRLSYNVLRQADIFVGARYVRGNYKKAANVRYDTGMHIGLSLRF